MATSVINKKPFKPKVMADPQGIELGSARCTIKAASHAARVRLDQIV